MNYELHLGKELDLCDIVIYKKCIFDLHPHFWHRVPKTLGISLYENIKVSFVISVNDFGKHKGEGWLPEEATL